MQEKKQCMGCMEYYDAVEERCPHCGYVDGQESRHVLHLKPGTLLKKRYVVGKSLGYGSFGVTYIGWDRLLRHKVAIKEYLPSEYATRILNQADLILTEGESKREHYKKGKERFRREAERLAKLEQIDGVVYIYDYFDENNTSYIVMEYLQGETLASYMSHEGELVKREFKENGKTVRKEVRQLSEERTMELMLPVLQSLQTVHENGIIHRDISPDNIFVSHDSTGKEVVKLIDFGASRFAGSSHSKSLTVLLRPGYSPEEQYRSSGEQGPHTDVYAIAAVMYQMVTGIKPVDALERRTSIERKKKELLIEPSRLNPNLSENFETALLNALNVKIEDRTATANDFISELISYEKVKRRGSSIKKIDFMKWPLWAKIGVPAGGAAAVAIAVFVIVMLSKIIPPGNSVLPEGYTRVPSFVGVSMETAQEKADEQVLVINQTSAEYSPNVEENLIIRQDTTEGAVVLENSVVNLTVSTGIEDYLMPDVTGMSVSDAREALECMDLEVLTEEGEQAGLMADSVISQDIEPYEEISSGDTVTLTVTPEETADATENVKTAISVTGMSYEEALALADSQGTDLVVTKKVFTKDAADGQILEQDVAAGTEINENRAIGVTVALAWREFNMPNLMYKSQDVALQLLENIGITAEVTQESSEIVAQGLVFEQSIEEDTTVEPNQEATVKVSTGSTPFEMVDLTGLTEEKARAKLTELKLVANIQYGYDENVAEGCVISQSVAGGDSITRGSEVILTICSSEGLVEVQDVTGKTSDEAKSILEGQGLVVYINEEQVYSDAAAEGCVTEQLPAAGSKQPAGATIVLTISKGVDPSKEEQADTNTSENQTTTNNNTNTDTSSDANTAGNSSGESNGETSAKTWGEWSEWTDFIETTPNNFVANGSSAIYSEPKILDLYDQGTYYTDGNTVQIEYKAELWSSYRWYYELPDGSIVNDTGWMDWNWYDNDETEPGIYKYESELGDGGEGYAVFGWGDVDPTELEDGTKDVSESWVKPFYCYRWRYLQ